MRTPELVDEAAALLPPLARDHPLVDGNGRLARAEAMVLAADAGELDAAALGEVVRRHPR